MTAINPNTVANGGDIPNDVTSLEALIFWAGSKYNEIYGAATYSELSATAVDNGQRTIGTADVAQTPAGSRGIVRASFPIAADWATAGVATYLSIGEQSAAVLP